jgi:hypothetical protein
MGHRVRRRNEIDELDAAGLALCERLAVELTCGAGTPKVEYCSEGELRVLR